MKRLFLLTFFLSILYLEGNSQSGGVPLSDFESPPASTPSKKWIIAGNSAKNWTARDAIGYIKDTLGFSQSGGASFSGQPNRIPVFANNTTLTTSGNFLMDLSSTKVLLGQSVDTTIGINFITNGPGLLLRGTGSTTLGMATTGSNYHWWQQYITDGPTGKFAIWSDAIGGSDKFKLAYSDGRPTFNYFTTTQPAIVAADKLLITESDGDLKSLSNGANGQYLSYSTSGLNWSTPAVGPTYTPGSGIYFNGNQIVNIGLTSSTGNGLSVTSNTTTPNSVSLTGYLASQANLTSQSGLLLRNGTTNANAVATTTGYGVPGQVLTTNSTANGVIWTTPGAGSSPTIKNAQLGRTLSQTITATTAATQSIAFTSNSIPTAYFTYNSTNNTIELIEAGKYYVVVTAALYSEATSGTYNQLGIFNGSTPIFISFQNLITSRQTSISVGGIINVPANYLLNVKAGTNTTNSYNFTINNPYFSIIKLD